MIMNEEKESEVKELYETYPVPNYNTSEKVESHEWIIKILGKNIKKNSEILDLGCGTGEASCFLSRFGNVTGVDFSKSSIKLANKLKNNLGIKNIRFISGNIKEIKSNKKFDYIYSIGVLHHIPDIETALNNIKKMMSKDTIFVPFVYNYYSYWRFNHRLQNPKASNKSMYYDIYCHPYAKYYTEEEFVKILEKNGFKIISFWKKIPNILRIITGRGKMMGFACKLDKE